METITKKELISLRERLSYWEDEAGKLRVEANYYRQELQEAHALLGRVIHQASERWDSVNLTKYYPTNNLYHKRTTGNPSGKE